jgi:hypothetical protein
MEEIKVMTLYVLDENDERKQIATVAVADDGAPDLEKRSLPQPMPQGCELAVASVPLVAPAGARELFGRALAQAIPTYDPGRAEANELARTVRNQGRAIERIEKLLVQMIGRTQEDDAREAVRRGSNVDPSAPRRAAPLDETAADSGAVPVARVPRSIANEEIAALAARGAIDWAKIERDAQGGRARHEPIPVDFSREAPAADKHAPMERRAGVGLDNVRDASMNVGNPKTEIVTIGPDGEVKVKLPTFGESIPPRSDIK